jgi:hypothetical protein
VFDGRKIVLSEYKSSLETIIGKENTDKILDFFENNLMCRTCRKIFPINEFSHCKTNRNRMGRYSDCKTCARNKYIELKSML